MDLFIKESTYKEALSDYHNAKQALDECLDAIVYHRKGSRGADARVANSWFLNLLKRHGRVKPVEGEDLSKFRRPDV